MILGDLRAFSGRGDASGVLPLLSQAMSLTWGMRDDNQLTSHGYAEAGGVSNAVQIGADGTSDIPLAAQLNLAAYRIHPPLDLATRLLNTEDTPLSFPLTTGGAVDAVAFSPRPHAGQRWP